MPSLGPLPNAFATVKVRHIFTLNSRPAYNVYHMSYSSSPPTTADLNAVATQLQAAWNTNIKPRVANICTLTNVEVTDLASYTGAVGLNSVPSVGSITSTSMPNNAALCASFKTAYRFRGGHARMYIPGIPAVDSTTGYTWTGTAVIQWGNALNAWLTAVNAVVQGASNYKLVMLSYFTHDGAGNQIYRTPPDRYDVTSVVVRSRIDSQRRRLGKEVS